MSAISNALIKSRANHSIALNAGLQMKDKFPGIDFSSGSDIYQSNQFSSKSADKRRYSLFRGWVYAAINAIALEGSSQSPNVGKLTGSSTGFSQRSNPGHTKSYIDMIRTLSQKNVMNSHMLSAVPNHIVDKAARQELEVLTEHPLLSAMEKPNSFQYSGEFIYSFISNLTLTGFGYIVGGETDDGMEFFSIPTTWVTPIHAKGPFAEFLIRNPDNPSNQEGTKLDREQVAFAYLPNPSDPLSALSPAQAQSNAILIDDHIQSSQQRFFGNGIFPSVIITIGNNPHPDVVGGATRPRLTGPQRRQVEGMIGKVMSSGPQNYGRPAIIDGLIERIDKLSMTQTEMGWEKSEKSIRTRILSAFGVHPFILGEEIVGSYAQAYVVRDVFCQRVNVYLNLLSTIMTEFASKMSGDDKLLVWWDECKAKDPQLEERTWSNARSRDDVSQNEFRAFMGLPPDADRNESNINRNSLPAVTVIASQATAGNISTEQAEAILVGMGLPDGDAKAIAGEGPIENTDHLEESDGENEIEEEEELEGDE